MRGRPDEIYFDGVRFISSASAAEEFGFVRDYIARLCRQGLVRGRQVGKNWYVDYRTLQNFLAEQEHRKKITRQNLRTVMTAPPGGFNPPAHAAIERLQIIAHAPATTALAHTPVYALTSLAEFLHKVIALTLALMLTFGTYALVDPMYAKFAMNSISDEVASVAHSYDDATGGGIAALANRTQSQVASAAENPQLAAAGVADFFTGTAPSYAADLARALNTRVDALVYSIAFPPNILRSLAIAAPTGSVEVSIEPYARPAASAPARAAVSTSAGASPPPIIQRVIVEPAPSASLAQAGGVTEDELDAKLQQLKNSFTEQIASASAAQSTAVAQTYAVVAQTNAIDQLNDVTITGGSISGTDISAASLSVSGNTSLGSTTIASLNVSTSATTTFAGGIALTGGCVTVNGTCLGTGSGSGTPGGSATQIQFNDYGSFNGSSLFTFSTSTSQLSVLNASTTNATSTNFFGTNATTTNFAVIGLGTTTFSGGIALTGGCVTVNGTCLGTGSGSSASTTLFADNNTFSGNNVFTASTTFSKVVNLADASSTLTTLGMTWFSGISNSLLSANASGQVVASSTIGTNFLTGALGTINGSTFSAGGTITVSAASSTLLGDNNTFSGSNIFSGNITLGFATTTILFSTIASSTNLFSQLGSLGTLTLPKTLNALLSTNSSGQVVSTTTIGANVLLVPANSILAGNSTGQLIASTTIGTDLLSANTISGVTLGGTLSNLSVDSTLNGSAYNGSAPQTFGLNLATSNSWTASTTFTKVVNLANASSTLNTFGTAWLPNLTASSLLAVDATGKLVASSTIGTNLLTGALGTINGSTFSAGGTITVSAASSTLLGDTNTFSGTNVFSGNITLGFGTTTTLFSTIASSTNLFSQLAQLGTLNLNSLSNSLLSVNSSGQVVATTTLGSNILLVPANSILAGNASGRLVASTTIGTNLLSANTISGITLGQNLAALTATDNTLTFSGSYNGGAARTVGLNLSNANKWSALQTFSAGASSTLFSAYGPVYFGGTATSSFSTGGILSLTNAHGCTGSQALQTDVNGNVSCGTVSTGGASTGGGWTSTGDANNGVITNSTSTYVVSVGATTTPYSKLTVVSDSNSTTTLTLVPAAAQTADNLDIYSAGGPLTDVFTAAGSLGVGTSSPGQRLAVGGDAYITGTTTVGGNFSTKQATTTNLAITNIPNALLSTNVNGAVVATTTIASNLLLVPANSILAGNSSGALIASTTIGTNLLSANTVSFTSSDSSLSVPTSIALGASASFTLNLNNSNQWTASTTFTKVVNLANASSTLTTLGTTWIPSVTANSLLATDQSGKLVATSTIGENLLAAIPANSVLGNPTSASAVPTAVATSSLFNTAAAGVQGLLSGNDWTTFNNKVSSTSLSGASVISYTSGTGAITTTGGTFGAGNYTFPQNVTGTNIMATGTLSVSGLSTLGQASTTLFSSYGPAYFGGSATSSFNSTGQLTLANLASAVIAVNSSGQLVASTTIGTNLLTGALGTINGATFSVGGTITVSSASSTLLGDNNTFSGNDVFSSILKMTNGLLATASSTIGDSTQAGGLTISGGATTTANAYFASNVGIGGQPKGSFPLYVNGSEYLNGTLDFLGTDQDTISFNSGSAAGLLFKGGNVYGAKLTNADLRFDQNVALVWTNGTSYSASPDSGISRLSANKLAVGNGSAGDFTGTLAVGTLGVGTSSPSYALETVGAGHFTSFVDASYFVATSSSATSALAGSLTVNGATTLASATTTNLFSTTASSTNLFSQTASLGTLNLNKTSNALLSTNSAGQLVASTTIGTNLLTGTLGTINGSTFSAGGTITVSAASSTLLGDTNTFSASTTFTKVVNLQNASTTLSTHLGSTWFPAIIASRILAVDQNGLLVASSTIGTNLLSANTTSFTSSDSSLSVPGSIALGGTGSFTLTLSNSNSWTASTTFTKVVNLANASSTLNTFGTAWLPNLTASSLLAVDATGKLVASSTIGTNLLTGALGTINGSTFSAGGTITVSAASSTLLGDTNTFSGTNVFSGNITLGFGTTTTLFSTIASSTNLFSQTASLGTLNLKNTPNALLSTNSSGQVVASTTIGNSLLINNGALSVSAGAGLSGGGSVALGGSVSLSLNTANPNTWTGLQTFSANASSTLFSAYGPAYFGATATSSFGTNGSLTLNGLGTFASGFVSQASSTVVGNFTTTGSLFVGSTNSPALRQVLTSNRTYYVSTTGSDSNDGLTSGTPFRNIQHAVNVVSQNIDLAGFNVTIQLADGTYNESVALPSYVGILTQAQAAAVIQGNSGNHSAVFINPSSGNAFTAVDTGVGWTLKNLKLAASGSTILEADYDSKIYIDGVVFGAGNIDKASLNTGAFIEAINNGYTIASSSAVHDYALDGGEIINQAITITLSGSPNFSSAFAVASTNGTIDYQFTSFSGSATGQRFTVSNSGWIYTGSTVPNTLLPGNVNGTLGLSSNLYADTGTGDIGIGTTGPLSALDVNGGVAIGSFAGLSAAPSNGLAVSGNARFFENTTNDPEGLSDGSTAGTVLRNGYILSAQAGDAAMYLNRNGSDGSIVNFFRSGNSVGSISVTTTATNYGTGSDRRIKENIEPTTVSLGTLMQIPVVDFDFTHDPTHATTTGFVAQSLLPIFPESVTTNGDNGIVPLGSTSTPWTVDYGRVTPLIVKAIQDIANITSVFQTNLIAWLGNVENGIVDLFAANGHFSNELCVGSTCVTPAQFQAMVAASNSSQSSGEGSGGTSTSTSGNTSDASTTPNMPPAGQAPVIQINGDNPATIQVGDTYNDLGATIEGPQADLNLGIKTYLNGTLTSNIVLDTTTIATDTIDYVATDPSDLSATSTRTVIIKGSPSIIPTSSPEQGNASAATTTDSTSTAQ